MALFLATALVPAHNSPTDLSCVSRVWPPPGITGIYDFTGGEVREPYRIYVCCAVRSKGVKDLLPPRGAWTRALR